jgi:hypothetical protein
MLKTLIAIIVRLTTNAICGKCFHDGGFFS